VTKLTQTKEHIFKIFVVALGS